LCTAVSVAASNVGRHIACRTERAVGVGRYEKAYLCGGPDRAARLALVSLHATGSVRMTGSSPHRVERAHGRTGHPIEMALLKSLPISGMPVRLVLRKLADSPEVTRCATVLLGEKLLRRSLRGLVRPTVAGVELHERLTAEVGDDEVLRFAVLGIAPEVLRPVLAELAPETTFPVKLPRRKTERGYDERGAYSPPDRYT
jgi:hypothetical protein